MTIPIIPIDPLILTAPLILNIPVILLILVILNVVFVILLILVILSEAKNLPLHPMQRHIHEQRREHTTLSYPRLTGEIGSAIYHTRSQPRIDGLPESRKGLQL